MNFNSVLDIIAIPILAFIIGLSLYGGMWVIITIIGIL